MLAEALNEIGYTGDDSGEAFTLLNSIRSRAGVSTYDSDDLPDQTLRMKEDWNSLLKTIGGSI